MINRRFVQTGQKVGPVPGAMGALVWRTGALRPFPGGSRGEEACSSLHNNISGMACQAVEVRKPGPESAVPEKSLQGGRASCAGVEAGVKWEKDDKEARGVGSWDTEYPRPQLRRESFLALHNGW